MSRGVLAIGIVVGAVLAAAKMQMDRQRFWAKVNGVAVVPPRMMPPPGQKSLDEALSIFGIAIPTDTDHPLFDATLTDRGGTSLNPEGRFQVRIGPSAFSSWALLGSTLAHEIEVHCQQDFFLISALDLLGADATGRAERTAYRHELVQGGRFGLSAAEQQEIAYTVRYFYPVSGAGARRVPGALVARVRSWIGLQQEPAAKAPHTFLRR